MIFKKSKKYQLIVFLFFIFVAIVVIFSDYGIIKRSSLERQSTKLQEEIILQKQITDSIQIAIDKLKNDTFEIEKIAREKYGMSKKNEEVYYINPK